VILYPAIDIREGRAVRLVRGDYDQEIAYDADPLDAARRWAGQGARALHVVDLDGARAGGPQNLAHVERIARELGVAIQLGGGLRDADAVEAALAAGADRVVLGTAAVADPDLVDEMVKRHGERVVVSVDARSGDVAAEGWERDTGVGVEDLLRELATQGVGRFVYTPIEVDGTMTGPLTDRLRSAAVVASECGTELLYSGGVGSLDDLRGLAELRLPSLAGVIVGRALYEGRFTVAEGQDALGG
jgi:phosphoribosylformimino-5-aminoimidazole carboxamide ribotide isomerase